MTAILERAAQPNLDRLPPLHMADGCCSSCLMADACCCAAGWQQLRPRCCVAPTGDAAAAPAWGVYRLPRLDAPPRPDPRRISAAVPRVRDFQRRGAGGA
jgi:hypothetical protein